MKTNLDILLNKNLKFRYNFNGSVNGFQCLYSYFFLPGFQRFSTSSSKEGNASSSSSSFAKFLVNNLGFSKNQSLSTSARLASWRGKGGVKLVTEFNWVGNADSVIQFFKQIGFQQSDIKIVVCSEPRILLSRVNQTLKPKIKLLNDLGLSGSDLVQTIVRYPLILRQTLGPAIHAFRTVLGSDDDVVRVIKNSHKLHFGKAAKYLIPNVELLQSYCGISSDKIQKYIWHEPIIYSMERNSFRNLLIRVEEKLGIPRNSGAFVYGIYSVAVCSDENIDDKCEIFKSFGWTQSDVMELIRRQPLLLRSNKETIKEKLNFLMNQLGYKPAYLAFQSSFFTYSIEKRLLPRHRILQVLKEKGLIEKHHLLSSASVMSEALFLKRFVLPYKEIPELYAQLTGSTVKSLIVKGRNL